MDTPSGGSDSELRPRTFSEACCAWLNLMDRLAGKGEGASWEGWAPEPNGSTHIKIQHAESPTPTFKGSAGRSSSPAFTDRHDDDRGRHRVPRARDRRGIAARLREKGRGMTQALIIWGACVVAMLIGWILGSRVR